MTCHKCLDTGWVCENHLHIPWGDGYGCGCGGAGTNCDCNPHGLWSPEVILASTDPIEQAAADGLQAAIDCKRL
jgi:hypothetical protein